MKRIAQGLLAACFLLVAVPSNADSMATTQLCWQASDDPRNFYGGCSIKPGGIAVAASVSDSQEVETPNPDNSGLP